MRINRENNKLKTDWYCKNTVLGRMIYYYSNQPTSQKTNTAYNFISKVIDVSHPQYHQKTLKIIADILTKNNYPTKLNQANINNTSPNISSKFMLNTSLN